MKRKLDLAPVAEEVNTTLSLKALGHALHKQYLLEALQQPRAVAFRTPILQMRKLSLRRVKRLAWNQDSNQG